MIALDKESKVSCWVKGLTLQTDKLYHSSAEHHSKKQELVPRDTILANSQTTFMKIPQYNAITVYPSDSPGPKNSDSTIPLLREPSTPIVHSNVLPLPDTLSA